jgi:hypothetical protein
VDLRAQLDVAGMRTALRAAADVMVEHRAALDRLELAATGREDMTAEELVAETAELEGQLSGDASGGFEPDAVPAPDAGVLAGADLEATLGATASALDGAVTFAEVASVLERVPAGAATGAAGGGVALLLAGLAESVRNADSLDAGRFAIGLEIGAERLAERDQGVRPGRLAAVVAAAADAALAAVDDGADLAEAIISAADDGLVELECGPQVDPVLAERGVVEAGAAGVLLLLDVLASVVTGEPLPAAPSETSRPPAGAGSGAQRYRVACRVEPYDGNGLESSNWLESTWHEMGELEEFRRGSAWQVALVTVVPGAAIEAIHDVGRPRELHIAVVTDD